MQPIAILSSDIILICTESYALRNPLWTYKIHSSLGNSSIKGTPDQCQSLKHTCTSCLKSPPIRSGFRLQHIKKMSRKEMNNNLVKQTSKV